MWQTIYREFRRWATVSGRAAAAYRRTEITVETDRVLIIRKSNSTRVWCAECGREVDMVDLDLAEPAHYEARTYADLTQYLETGTKMMLDALRDF